MPDRTAAMSPEQRRHLAERLWRRHAQTVRAEAIPIVPRQVQRPFPLSPAQERMWCVDCLRPGSGIYNVLEARAIDGPVDRQALEACIAEIVRRHEILRVVFVDGDDGPLQSALPDTSIDLPTVDLGAVPPDAQLALLRRLAHSEGRRPFDLARGPLLRVVLFRLAHDRHVFWLAFHHVIADGWSSEIFQHELKTLYHAWQMGEPSPLAPLPAVQYLDFAHWQHTRATGDVHADLLREWREALDGAPATVVLRRQSMDPRLRDRRAARAEVVVDGDVGRGLERLASERGVTRFAALAAAFGAALARLTGQQDLLIGTPVSDRRHPDLEPLIGYFLNTLLLRLDLRGRPRWHECLDRVAAAVRAAQLRAEVPFQEVVRHCRPADAAGDLSLFNVWLTLVNTPQRASPRVLEPWRLLPVDTGIAQFDLALVVWPTASGIHGFLEYDVDVVDPPTALRLVDDIARDLTRAVAREDAPVFDGVVAPSSSRAAAATPAIDFHF